MQGVGGPGKQDVTMEELLDSHIEVEIVMVLVRHNEKVVRIWG